MPHPLEPSTVVVELNERRTTSRMKNIPPPNSLRYYRQKAGLTLSDVAKLLGTTHQTIQRLEERGMKLTPEWADRTSAVIGNVPASLIGFSDAPDAYMWAARAVPVIGTVDVSGRIDISDAPWQRIGVTNRPTITSALSINDPTSMIHGWFLVFDGEKAERITQNVLTRQESRSSKFIVRLKDGTMWWRRIIPGARRNIFHLAAENKPMVLDVEIESVSEVLGIEGADTALPPLA